MKGQEKKRKGKEKEKEKKSEGKESVKVKSVIEIRERDLPKESQTINCCDQRLRVPVPNIKCRHVGLSAEDRLRTGKKPDKKD